MGKKKNVGLAEETINKEANKVVEEMLLPKEEVVEETIPEVEAEEVVEEPVVDEAEAVVDGVQMNLNVRKEPKVASNNQIGILAKGTKVIVMSPKKTVENGGEHWLNIRFGNPPQEGYAMKKYIRMI